MISEEDKKKWLRIFAFRCRNHKIFLEEQAPDSHNRGYLQGGGDRSVISPIKKLATLPVSE